MQLSSAHTGHHAPPSEWIRQETHVLLDSGLGSSGFSAWGGSTIYTVYRWLMCNPYACHSRGQTCTGSSSSLPSSFTSAGTMLPMAKRMTSPGTRSEASITCSNLFAVNRHGTLHLAHELARDGAWPASKQQQSHSSHQNAVQFAGPGSTQRDSSSTSHSGSYRAVEQLPGLGLAVS